MSRTIPDLASEARIGTHHLAEALQYRLRESVLVILAGLSIITLVALR